MINEKRKLAVALFADIKGYTAMMQNDEDLAVSCLNRFKDSIEKEVPLNNGKVIQFYGDGVLILFDSAAEAVQCALDLQLAFIKEPAVPVRIGLNDGEVILKDDNAFGDSINIASRIESIGIPGAILFSGSIQDQIHNQKKFETHFVGKFDFKNVNKKLEVYALKHELLPIPRKAELTGKLKEKKLLSWKVMTGAILFLIGTIFLTVKFMNDSIAAEPTVFANWVGNWNQKIEGEDGVLVTGQVQFIDSLGALLGYTTNEYQDIDYTTKNKLFGITISEDGNKILGKWKSLSFVEEGNFEFILDESNNRKFDGYYLSRKDTSRYLWSGSRD